MNTPIVVLIFAMFSANIQRSTAQGLNATAEDLVNNVSGNLNKIAELVTNFANTILSRLSPILAALVGPHLSRLGTAVTVIIEPIKNILNALLHGSNSGVTGAINSAKTLVSGIVPALTPILEPIVQIVPPAALGTANLAKGLSNQTTALVDESIKHLDALLTNLPGGNQSGRKAVGDGKKSKGKKSKNH